MISGLIYLAIYLIIIGVVLWLLTYLLDVVPMPPQFKQVARVVIIVVGVLIAILVLLNFVGILEPPPRVFR